MDGDRIQCTQGVGRRPNEVLAHDALDAPAMLMRRSLSSILLPKRIILVDASQACQESLATCRPAF